MIIVDESDPIDDPLPTFPYRDVTTRRDVSIREAYEVLDEIGRGKFGRVYRCRDRETGLMLAAKVVTTKRKEERRNVEREIEIMKKLQHPRLIQLFDAIDDTRNLEMCLILEMVGGGELFDRVIQDEFVLTERCVAVFVRQICEAVEYIHSQNVLHLDMKPENVMCLSKNGNRIKIIDFGLARFYDPTKKLQILFGTPEFVAPEVVNFEEVDYATDMWSIGVITYVLLSGLSPFMGETDVETMANVTIAKYDFDDECFDDISDDAKDFISQLLVKDKKKRLTATECLRNSWLLPRPTSFSSPPDPVSIHQNPSSLTHTSSTTSINQDNDENDEEETIMTCTSSLLPEISSSSTTTTNNDTVSLLPPYLEIVSKTAPLQHNDEHDEEEVEEDNVEVEEEEIDVELEEVKHNHIEEDVDIVDDDDESSNKTVRLSPNLNNYISTISNCGSNSRCSSNSLGGGDQSSESESGYSGSGLSDLQHDHYNPSRDSNNTTNQNSSMHDHHFNHHHHHHLSSNSNVKHEPEKPQRSSSNSSINLELSKNNLRYFVEHWKDDVTPYLFDSPRGIITHLCTTDSMLPDTTCTHTHSQTNLSNGNSYECGNIVNQIRRFSYQLHNELEMMKNHCNRKCSWDVSSSVNAQ